MRNNYDGKGTRKMGSPQRGRDGMTCLEVRVNDDLEKAIRALKKKMAQEGLYKEMKKRRFYEKPSVRRKRKSDEAERRRRKNAHR